MIEKVEFGKDPVTTINLRIDEILGERNAVIIPLSGNQDTKNAIIARGIASVEGVDQYPRVGYFIKREGHDPRKFLLYLAPVPIVKLSRVYPYEVLIQYEINDGREIYESTVKVDDYENFIRDYRVESEGNIPPGCLKGCNLVLSSIVRAMEFVSPFTKTRPAKRKDYDEMLNLLDEIRTLTSSQD